MSRLSEIIKEERIDELIVEVLLNSLEDVDDPHLVHALHTVIAYHSVPGMYEQGKYDNDTS